jgi:sterol desaturase/sphingolipid hydroxylase (fatty acid hydroxylase superfamily)
VARPDLTVLAIPAFVGAMGAEYAWQRSHPAPPGTARAGDYELADTLASLTMGVGSLVAPFVTKRLLDPVTPGVGRHAKLLMGAAVLATAVTTVADLVRRRGTGALPPAGTVPARVRGEEPASDAVAPASAATPRTAHGAMAVTAVASTALTVATTWAAQTSASHLFGRTGRDLGTGWKATAFAILGWDAIYYWNHRFSHECRWLWAMHVVHHSSERYNLSTALRQPVAEAVTLSVPYGLLSLAGVRPSVLENARALNLIYQFWIHTEAVRSIGWLENLLNTPSHHRVHHGTNRQYLDRNHGSILIVWDRIFGTFEREDERVVYGLTTNVETFNPLRIATHEWRDVLRDIATAGTWGERWSFLLRGPGWAADRRAGVGAASLSGVAWPTKTRSTSGAAIA